MSVLYHMASHKNRASDGNERGWLARQRQPGIGFSDLAMLIF